MCSSTDRQPDGNNAPARRRRGGDRAIKARRPPSSRNGPIAGLLAHIERVCLGIVFVGIIVLVCALGLAGP